MEVLMFCGARAVSHERFWCSVEHVQCSMDVCDVLWNTCSVPCQFCYLVELVQCSMEILMFFGARAVFRRRFDVLWSTCSVPLKILMVCGARVAFHGGFWCSVEIRAVFHGCFRCTVEHVRWSMAVLVFRHFFRTFADFSVPAMPKTWVVKFWRTLSHCVVLLKPWN
jgi:hypothetical protein